MSRGRHELTGAPLAPRNNVTLEELRWQRPQEQQSAIPQEIPEVFSRKSSAGSAPCVCGLSHQHLWAAPPDQKGATCELLRVCLDDHETLDLLCSAAEDFARAACAPFQFALSTRAGTDCVDHAIRAATDADHEATVLSIDGVGAYGHVHQSAMLSKLLEVPSLQPLLPFVRAAYTEPARYKWQDDEGHRHDIEQHEGGEQGDPLMPLLFSLAIDNALAAVKEELEAGEMLFAFLDDIFVLSRRDRMRPINNLLAEKLHLSMQARHARGTRVGRGHQMSTIWDMTCGMVMASRYWTPVGSTPSCSPTPMSDWKRRTGCGR